MDNKSKEIIQAELNLLLSLKFTHAYTGELGRLQEKTYVDYSIIIGLINKKRREIYEINKSLQSS